ncbi:MAG: carboxypeptidase-like regulatory domain-containing protein, partial [Crocinitomix sp.]|nr:carboxypeptidase-like regulatory domain-containing protein [Crocinitomix sp.]
MAHLIKYTLLFFVLMIGFFSYAQEVGISGKVLNEEGEPIESVTVQIDGTNKIYITNEDGFFQFQVAPNTTYLIRFAQGRINTKKKFIVGETSLRGLVITLGDRTLDIVDVVSVRTGDFTESFPQLELNRIASPSQNFEDIIKVVGLGVNSSNELTSNYNVRGGNYDENLIYVNGIEIYRPFLARSGQQEGLSFINPAFVNNIFFSSGGFDSYYGDKLSSILDIRYRQPTEFGGSGEVSLMGAQAHIEGCFDGNRGSYITGARYRVNSYLLNSLPTKGDYNPTFFDYQFLTNYYLKFDTRANYVKIFALGHFSTNNYLFQPSSRTTSWGTVNEAYQLRVFFEGQEETKFQTFTAATGLESMYKDKLKMTFIASVFRSVESEHFDILGEYLINELDT